MEKDLMEKLFNDYLNLAENYQNELNVQQFGFLMIHFSSKMLMECGNEKEMLDIIYKACTSAIEFSEV
jgi:hypothetical protein